ncbi:MAG: dTDP-4-dehydrorhamnose reductase [Candidatus Dadabacteria bacterium]|nr:MAG: dTDP-4-dehydrorhamnose reductase [Candidatus Dadabacteria bacterium]
MKILLFGGTGQLGSEVRARVNDLNFELFCPVLSELDITDREEVLLLSRKVKPDVIVNCAAYTAVDDAENNREEAFKINCDGAGFGAQAAKEVSARYILVSTDYVFGDGHSSPIKEDAETSPLNVYGESKLAGEKLVNTILGGEGLIVRTSSLHGQFGANFVHTMIELFKAGKEVNVVADQIMSPTYAGWLADVLLDLVRTGEKGILHACCRGEISWYDFASEIYKCIGAQVDPDRKVRIEPVPSSDFPRPARRPAYSVLDTSRLVAVLGREPLSWQEGLRAHLRDLKFEC